MHMKKMLSIFATILTTVTSFTQAAGTETGSVQQQAESIPVDALFLVMCMAMLISFIYLIVYSLSKAVRVLALQKVSER
jgi:hypothetical protein